MASPRFEANARYARIAARAQADGCLHRALATLGREDLFFLLTQILKRKDADNDWVYARCREVQTEPNDSLDLWAREHYKSTIITFALTIQDILNDPEVTIGIFSHTRPIAKGFLKQIMREFEVNELLKEIYADVLWADPRRDAPMWSEDGGIIVRRKGNPKEATVEAWGLVDGQPTGKHFGLSVYDDVVTRESVTTPEMITKVTDAWALSLNLGSHGGRRRYIGTRYHFNDTYKAMLDRKAATPRIYAATRDGRADGEPVFLTREALEEKRRTQGPYVFSCQMLQNPAADDAQGFRLEWVNRYSRINPAEMNTYLLVDPAGEKKRTSDYTVMVVVGLGVDGNYYLIDGVRDRMNLTERATKLLSLHRLHRPVGVGYEKYGKDADIEHILFVQDQQNYRFKITPMGGATPKADRIRKLVPLFEQGRFYLPQRLLFIDCENRTQDFVQLFLNEEYLSFPVAVHDDMLDCVARIVDPALGACFPEKEDGRFDLEHFISEARSDETYDPFAGME